MEHTNNPTESSGKQAEPVNLKNFLNLSLELREVVYGQLLAAGQMLILRTSREVHSEAMGIFKFYVAYRFTIDDKNNPEEFDSRELINPQLREISIHMITVDGRYFNRHFQSPYIKSLVAESRTHKTRCSIDLNQE